MTLAELAPGDRASILGISTKTSLRRRLFELGLTPGVELEVVRRAPLGDPMEIFVRGYRLSLRGGDASAVECAAIVPKGAKEMRV